MTLDPFSLRHLVLACALAVTRHTFGPHAGSLATGGGFARLLVYFGAGALAIAAAGLVIVGARRRFW